jgi:V/A-type H+-transporting ATPase subunit I
MIEPMKKMSVIVKDIDRTTSLRELRSLGVLHLNDTSSSSLRVEELQEQYDHLSRICHRIEQTSDELTKKSRHTIEEQIRVDEVLHKLEELVSMITEEQELAQNILTASAEIDRLSIWGDFSPYTVKRLAQKGISLKFYIVSEAYLQKRMDDDIRYIVLRRFKKKAQIAVLDRELEADPEVVPFQIPKQSISDLNHQIDFAKKRRQEIQNRFYDEARFLRSYREVLDMIMEELRFEIAHSTMEGNGAVAWITGFVPEDSVEQLRTTAREQGWGLLIEKVTEQDPVPTKLKNNAFVRLIEPIFDILGTVPGYREYDVSLFFLLFFSVFFAMIIGDAGYGLIFLGGTIALHAGTKKFSEPVRLLYLLSGTTIVWGAATGNWFGSDAILAAVPFLQSLTIEQIASFPELFDVTQEQTQNTVMYICFVLGILQLGLACIINFLRKFPKPQSFADLGWLSMLAGLYQVVLNLVIGQSLAGWTIPAVTAGFIVYVVFSNQGEGVSFLKGLLLGIAGLFNTFLDSISAFSNIISYIRLFAVGMASLAIATSFNSMAEPMLGGWALPAAILILLIGHGLNLIMGILSVVVHGVRLNMLEFSGQLGMEWTGIKYEPFKEHLDSSLGDGLPTTK